MTDVYRDRIVPADCYYPQIRAAFVLAVASKVGKSKQIDKGNTNINTTIADVITKVAARRWQTIHISELKLKLKWTTSPLSAIVYDTRTIFVCPYANSVISSHISEDLCLIFIQLVRWAPMLGALMQALSLPAMKSSVIESNFTSICALGTTQLASRSSSMEGRQYARPVTSSIAPPTPSTISGYCKCPEITHHSSYLCISIPYLSEFLVACCAWP